MKKILILFLACFSMTQVMSAPVFKTDDETFIKLIDSLSAALVSHNNVWLSANLTEECSLSDPSGQTLAKEEIIKAFSSAGIYTLTKMKPSNMKYVINDIDASGAGNIDVEGAMSAREVIDVSGTYHIEAGFKKTDAGWKISWIRVSQ
jgi:hypothetical protein